MKMSTKLVSALVFAIATLATAAQAKTSMPACPSPEVTVMPGTRSQACHPSTDGHCGSARILRNGECRPEITTFSSRPKLTMPGGSSSKPSKAAHRSACPAPERAVNAGTRSEYCLPLGRRCGDKRVLTHSKLFNRNVCEPVRLRRAQASDDK